jgi:GntR family transcriptional regulator
VRDHSVVYPEKINALPLYVRIKESIVKMIREGAFPGNRLPPESDLSESLGVSRTTIREALASLSREGIISKRHGIGNLIHQSTLNSKMRIDRYQDFVAILKDAGHRVEVERVDYRWLSEKETLYIELCYYADGERAIGVEVFIPGNQLKDDPTGDTLLYNTLPDFLNKYAVEPVSHSLCLFRPAVADADSSKRLNLPEGAPILEWEESFYTIFDSEIARTLIFFNPSIVSFSLLRKWE